MNERRVPLSVPDREVVDESGESPTVEVRVWRGDDLIHRELCESAEIASAVVASWSDVEGVRCEIADLSSSHRPDDILAPDPEDVLVDPPEGDLRG